MKIRKFFRNIPIVYIFYRKIFLPFFHKNDLNILLLRKFTFNHSLDIGANVGTYAIELQKNSKTLYCFEPLTRNINFLKLLLNKNAKYFKFALGNNNENNFIKIPLNESDELEYALSSVKNNFSNYIKKKIKIKKLDKLYYKSFIINNLDFVKIDVEGFEFQVLQGMRKILKKTSPIFLIEIEERHNKNFMQVINFLSSRGYKTYVTKNGATLEYLNNKLFKKIIKKKIFNNFWFVKY
jgi:FkbM family methyltransferase